MTQQTEHEKQKFECDGGGINGHPKVFIQYKDNAACPYCGKIFNTEVQASDK